ncbi:hypothetical protein ACFRJ1_38910 [Streptomyces sp. NPDC056773]|uniref:hypothetical protein n=1 Tax=unclassified Streptomyces TaxID=2593676 RepID=UPI0036BD9570
MMNSEPVGLGADDQATLERVLATLRENEQIMGEIARLSDVSFRRWVDSLAQRLSAALALSLGHVTAFLDDFGEIARRTVHTFADAYDDGYSRGRRVPPHVDRRRGRRT